MNLNRKIAKPFASARAAYIDRARRMLLLDLLHSDTATADDIWDVLPPPAGVDARCLCAVPGVLVHHGIIRAVDRVSSLRPERHGAAITVWALADRDAALRFLDSSHTNLMLEA
jgi:hypothetical protein